MQDHIADRHKLIEQTFAELRHIEGGFDAGSQIGSSRYIDGGDWFVRPMYALACVRKRLRRPSHQPILAGVSLKSLARLGRSYLRRATFPFDSRAAAVNLRLRSGGNRVIRSFYPSASQPATVKALWRPPSCCSMLEAEVENRRVAEDVGHLTAPKIFGHNLSGRAPFLVEEFITGRIAFRRRDQALLCQTLLPSLQCHYKTFGVTFGPIESCFGNAVCAKVEQAAELLTWDRHWKERQQFMSVVARLANSEKQLTLSFCHGDLSIAHVVVSEKGRLFLLDWEKAGVQPIAVDLATIERTCRVNGIKLFAECRRLLCELSLPGKSNDFFSPAEQIFLASLRRIVAWREKHQSLYELQGRDPKAKLKSEFANANTLLKNL